MYWSTGAAAWVGVVVRDRPGPLAGLRVFDLTLWMAGPWAGMQLGALGADVLHVERPGTPPEQLGHVPPFVNVR